MANKSFRFVATVVLAHVLSASNFGLVNVGIAISGIALIATSLGLPDLGSRDVAVAPDRVGWLAGHVATVRAAALLVVGAAAIPLAMLVWPGHTLLLVIAAAMAVFMSVQTDWAARGLERMSLVAVANAAGGAAVLAGAVAATRVSRGATVALAAFAVGEAVVAVTLWTRLRATSRIELGVRGMGSMIRRARHLALSSLAIYIYYANLDTIILAASHSTREAGLYSAPYRLFLVLNLVGAYAAYAMLPTLARLADGHHQRDADRLLGSTLVVLAGYGLFALGVVELVGGDVLRVLFGHAFSSASGTFVLLVAGVAWYAIGYPAGYSLIATHDNARYLRGAATASILNIVLDFALIPPLGMRGAGLATMVAFSAAALVWMQSRRLLTREALTMLTALVATSGAALFLVFDNRSTRIAGAATLAIAVAVLGRWALPRWWTKRSSQSAGPG